MTEFVLPAPAPTTLPVSGSAAVFPVGRVFCIGRNYKWSAHEATPVDMPGWFMKPANAVVPAHGVLPYPPCTGDFCHEIELVVAIGRGGRDIGAAQVQSHHVWGYAAGLDLTRRDLQQQAKRAGGPWEAAKAFDHSAPCTPLVPAAACGHPERGAVWLTVNGVERQRADLCDLIWSVPERWPCCPGRWRSRQAISSTPARPRVSAPSNPAMFSAGASRASASSP